MAKLDIGKGQVLEVGAGMGHFLAKISPAIYPPDRVTALEYNVTARKEIAARCHTALATDVLSLDAPDGAFETILLFQVLEHLDRSHEVFASLSRLTAPGGHVFIGVPNAALIQFVTAHDSLADTPPNHIGRWTRKNFDQMAAKYGFTIVDSANEPFSLKDFVRTDAVFSYMHKAFQRRGIAGKLYAHRKSRLGRVANIVAVGANAFSRLPVWNEARKRGAELGGSSWFHLHRLPRQV